MATTAKKPRVFILTSRVYEIAGGRTKATITRMMFLQKHYDVILIEMSATKYPGEELSKVFAKYQTKFNAVNPWRVGEKSHMDREKNYLEFVKTQTGGLGDEKILAGAQESFVLSTLSGGKLKSYIENGSITRLREFHPNGMVEFFALDEKQNVFLRELYDKDKLLARYYLDNSGKVCSGFALDKDDNKKFIYRTKDDSLFYSDNITEHNVVFLNDILRDGDVLISDVRYYDEVLEKLKAEVHKIHVWHEIVTDLPGEVKINPAYEKIISPSFPMSDSDKIVVFTDDARNEYANHFPHLKNNFTVIPYGTDVKPDTKSIVRDKNLIISVGRLVPAKNIAAQIRAFAIFHKKYPQTKFHIFGEGSHSEALLQLVEELKLSSAVKLCGFSHSIDDAFQSAGMMIFSSNNETFGLIILESLRNGTPVASYNVRFGVKMMIDNLQNGMIAKENTPESLAKAMIKLHKAKITPQQVRASIGHTFSRENFEEKWLTIISNDAKKR